MTRRDANWLILRATALAGAADFMAAWARAAEHVHSKFAPPDPHDWSAYQPHFFSREEFKMLDAFTDILIPADDTPGARAAHVSQFIDFVVNAAGEYAPETQQQWRKTMSVLAKRGFLHLTSEQQRDLVGKMSQESTGEDSLSYQLIKEMTIRAFYTSRVGLVDVLDYQGIAYLTEYPGCPHPEHHQV